MVHTSEGKFLYPFPVMFCFSWFVSFWLATRTKLGCLREN